jgi:acyl-CoA:acyl-CoA alkyltransferase
MKYQKVHIDAISYELGPVVVTSAELEARLRPLYQSLHIAEGQLEALTGIVERRWWEPETALSQGAVAAARKALNVADCGAEVIETLIYAGVCRENFEPATACRVAAELGIEGDVFVYDISNACLGVLNGMIDIANRIELGQIRAGMVVSCESSREIVDTMIEGMLDDRSMDNFKYSLATLTGGSGAVAVLLSDGSLNSQRTRRLLGGVQKTAPAFHDLCRWGLKPNSNRGLTPFMSTDSVSVLKHGVKLGKETWSALLDELGWTAESVDKVICHQVGSGHRDSILNTLNIDEDKEFSSHEFLGNIGTVSLPLTAALAEERDFLDKGDRVGFLGIGSGLNCLMLGLEW